MVRLATAAVAALVIVPAIAAPIAQQGNEDFEARAFDECVYFYPSSAKPELTFCHTASKPTSPRVPRMHQNSK